MLCGAQAQQGRDPRLRERRGAADCGHGGQGRQGLGGEVWGAGGQDGANPEARGRAGSSSQVTMRMAASPSLPPPPFSTSPSTSSFLFSSLSSSLSSSHSLPPPPLPPIPYLLLLLLPQQLASKRPQRGLKSLFEPNDVCPLRLPPPRHPVAAQLSPACWPSPVARRPSCCIDQNRKGVACLAASPLFHGVSGPLMQPTSCTRHHCFFCDETLHRECFRRASVWH